MPELEPVQWPPAGQPRCERSTPPAQITELYFWYAGGWDNSGSDWYFYAKRNLSCLAGERVVSGSCQTCPTYGRLLGRYLNDADLVQPRQPSRRRPADQLPELRQ